ncbi:hypothetical protein DSO57_1039203 [Entomophthora muscae]|uniref:Uncharacterized protein n=1 Tax=Entomophthora muscae TaxID=34485 RepID=A0ACC2UK40_9FUNG|nr:hypothetical protein DSO57_1039203 [Entomophthora muscae]
MAPETVFHWTESMRAKSSEAECKSAAVERSEKEAVAESELIFLQKLVNEATVGRSLSSEIHPWGYEQTRARCNSIPLSKIAAVSLD